MDTFPPAAQRKALLALAPSLGCSDMTLRRDECGDPRISGKHGHVYAVPGGFSIFVTTQSPRAWGFAKRAWGFAKKALSFSKLVNDGDDEGAFFLDRMPSKAEADLIRAYCGILKKRDLGDTAPSEAQIASRVAFTSASRARIAA
jgi:hypothetical protein